MDFLVNDRSIHGQFTSIPEFIASVKKLMAIRQEIKKNGREIYAHRGLTDVIVMPAFPMRKAVQAMPTDQKRSWLQFLTQEGPFWEDARQHSPGDWLESENEGDLLTDHAIGEAGYCKLMGNSRDLVSVDPSDWMKTPIRVIWRNGEVCRQVDVDNHWTLESVTNTLIELPPSYKSWQDLDEHCRRTCTYLRFTDTAFEAIKKHPFQKRIADRVLELLGILNRMQAAVDDHGQRTAEYHELYSIHFKSTHAADFTSESEQNKNRYPEKLTFAKPDARGETLFCPWHGKMKTQSYTVRIHFNWPVDAGETLYVVYVGPKLIM